MAYKLNAEGEGETIWGYEYGGRGNERFYGMAKTEDNGFLLVGDTDSFGEGAKDMYAVRIDSEGEVVWERTYGTNLDDFCSAVCPNQIGGWIVAGTTRTGEQIGDHPIMISIDEGGQEIWRLLIDEAGGCGIQSVALTSDGGTIGLGFSSGDNGFYCVRANCDGQIKWQHTYGDLRNGEGYCVLSMSDNSYVFGGQNGATLIARTEPDSLWPNSVIEPLISSPSVFQLSQPYPNPFNSVSLIDYSLSSASRISINVFDLNGRLVEALVETTQEAGYHRAIWKAGDAPAGLYLCRMEAGAFKQSVKLLLVR